MRLLLDTHVFLWWLRDDRRLGHATRAAIRGADDVLVSAASIWEIAIKAAVGKLTWRAGARTSLATCIDDCGFAELPVRAVHAAAVRDLPRHHADPFDRLLLTQATTEQLLLVSADDAMRRYLPDVMDPTR